MKIKIVQVVDVDPESWALEFGINEKDVRKDVKAYFANWCQDQVQFLSLEAL